MTLIEMEVAELVRTEISGEKKFGLFLIEKGGTRRLPMKISIRDAFMLKTVMEEQTPERPFLHWAVANIISALEGEMVRVVITEVEGDMLQAILELDGKDPIPIRPSDAVILASILKSPIFAAEEILETVSQDSKPKESPEERRARKIAAQKDAKERKKLETEIKDLDRAIDEAIEQKNFSKAIKLQEILHVKRLSLGNVLKTIDPGVLAFVHYRMTRSPLDVELQ